jgi:hypothetical protein
VIIKCLGTKVSRTNYIHGKVKSRLSFGNACCDSVQNLFSNKGIKLIIIFLVIFYKKAKIFPSTRHKILSRACLAGVLMRIFGPRRDELIK